MEMADYYVNEGSNMQYRDAKDVIEEFGCELSKMQGKCLDVGSGGGNVTKEILLPMLPHDAEVVGEKMKIWQYMALFNKESLLLLLSSRRSWFVAKNG